MPPTCGNCFVPECVCACVSLCGLEFEVSVGSMFRFTVFHGAQLHRAKRSTPGRVRVNSLYTYNYPFPGCGRNKECTEQGVCAFRRVKMKQKKKTWWRMEPNVGGMWFWCFLPIRLCALPPYNGNCWTEHAHTHTGGTLFRTGRQVSSNVERNWNFDHKIFNFSPLHLVPLGWR